eukprot:7945836-Pyramimonas_sp.AAC.1
MRQTTLTCARCWKSVGALGSWFGVAVAIWIHHVAVLEHLGAYLGAILNHDWLYWVIVEVIFGHLESRLEPSGAIFGGPKRSKRGPRWLQEGPKGASPMVLWGRPPRVGRPREAT